MGSGGGAVGFGVFGGGAGDAVGEVRCDGDVEGVVDCWRRGGRGLV